MSKLFEEVFSAYEIKPELNNIFHDVIIERIQYVRRDHLLKIYMVYNRLIQKKHIINMERELGKRISYGSEKVSVRFYEKYHLSEQYNPVVLLDSYYESILLELEKYKILLAEIMKKSTYHFENERLLFDIPDNPVSHNVEEELQNALEKMINDRFGFNVDIQFHYVEPKKSKYREEREMADFPQTNDLLQENSSLSEYGVKTLKAASERKEANNDKTGKENSGKEYKGTKTSGAKKWDKNSKKGEYTKTLRKSDNPDVIYSKDFEGEQVLLENVHDEIGDVVVSGQILAIDERFIEKMGKTMYKFEISDFTDSIKLKLFLPPDLADELRPLAGVGDFISAKGMIIFDKFDKELEMGSVFGIKKVADFRKVRTDNASVKRVELHCHTKMSDMDAVSDVGDIIKQAKKFGHRAIAITDHGNTQAFPDANHAVKPDEPFKVIYGVEGYLVDDLKQIVVNSRKQSLRDTYVVFDIETTGFNAAKNKIIEIGAVKIKDGNIVDRFSEFVNPQVPIPLEIEKLTGINDAMVINADTIEVILPRFLEFSQGAVMVAHNAGFDMGFIQYKAKEQGIDCDFTYVDTVAISRTMFPDAAKHTLDAVAKNLGVSLENHHRAVDDAEATAHIFEKFLVMLEEKGIHDLDALNDFGVMPTEAIRRLHPFHIIILAKNEIGRRNLYKLVSMSNLTYYMKRPKIPKSQLIQYREGLIVGSACEQGEIYKAIVEERSESEIAKLVDLYDYLEIQPIANNYFQIASSKFPSVETEEDLRDINRKIVELGEIYNKPVCATCDVHFLNPEDGIYRQIILAGKGFQDTDEQPPLFFRTTEEMLDEFSYLGMEKAEEVVIRNTNLIADMIEKITPVRPDKCPPVIEDSDKTLRKICYDKAHSMYGDPLPEIVKERLERELTSIIGNGYAVMYIIAQKLVWKSVEDGYLVGSRGSVGSSFVATMAGITEVNPLSPHYYCKKCHYNDFYSDEVKAYAGKAGCDMPDKMCPQCGEKLEKDGFDIPFETFLGFKGDKEPDIDLNFSGEYQSKAHKYTEVIFGYGQTFRAGTIGTLADKTAYGYVKNYFRERDIEKREGEINRIVGGCVGVRRTTGQHPGGIVVLPVGEDINSFTAVQHPANDMTTDIITTHFDYHKIEHNLLKLDILGHDDPTMIRMLQDLTNKDPLTIPLDDPQVMSLFQDTSALGVTPEQIRGTKLGSLGIPEFGTPFAMQMLIDTKPQAFSDLVRIAGLSHGTDVWLGNAQTLLEEGKATISTCICTRDDIMTYLIGKGLDPEESFKIMENVRKGKVAGGKCDKWPQWKEDMLAHGVPDWYIWSCEKIKYMFPKAHAAAYVMMAWRIAYCKINYPLAYYCAYFTVRAKAFSYELMCLGQQQLEANMKEFENRKKAGEKISPKEEDSYSDMKLVQEMYARGFEFWPIDLYQAQAKNFQIIDGKIMPAFIAIDGLGETVAVSIEDEAKQGIFISKDDLKQRAKVPQAIIDTMSRLHILDGLPESNQLSIFDFMSS
ncbi:MAG: PolC-type DNA polymerase III [Lachnospiraceae bacterium]